MRTQTAALAALFPLGLASVAGIGCATAQAQSPASSADHRDIQLTVYKDDFAMVRETRPADLDSGRNRVRLQDVSNSLDPNSVLIDFSSKGTRVVSTTFDMGVGDTNNALARLAGQEVQLMLPSQDGSPGKTIKGTLEPSRDGGYFLRSGEKLYVNPPGTIIAPANADVATLPQLSAEIDGATGGTQTMDLTYLSRGLSWSADYVARLEGGDRLNLELWATVTNRTGLKYPDAKIRFMAGSPNRAVRAKYQDSSFAGVDAMKSRAEPEVMSRRVVAPEAVGELYAYKAPAPASIGIDQMNRVPMMDPVSIPIVRDYSVALPALGNGGYYYYGQQPDQRISAQLAISFKNRKDVGLGIPLPSGAVRIYGSEGEGSAYVGAATIGDTPNDASVHLTLSKVFDVYAQPKVVASKKIDKRTVRKTMEVVLHNEKKSAVEMRLVQSLHERGKVVSENFKSAKLNASTLQWKVPVSAGGEATLRYEIEFKW